MDLNTFLATHPVFTTKETETFLIAAYLTEDAILAYHTTLLMHETAHFYPKERDCLSD